MLKSSRISYPAGHPEALALAVAAHDAMVAALPKKPPYRFDIETGAPIVTAAAVEARKDAKRNGTVVELSAKRSPRRATAAE